MSIEEVVRREALLHDAAAVVEACRKCAIGYTRTQTVYGEGDGSPDVMIVGEGPGENEDREGRPFIGRAGQLLDKMLASIDLPRERVFIANTVKCRPTLDDGVRLRNRAPDATELANCRPYLDEQLEILRPRILLCLGAPAAKSFLGPKFSITRSRGQWFPGPNGIEVMATFHPAYVLRMTGGELEATKRLVWTDLKAVRAKLDEPPAPPPAPEPESPQIGLFG